MKIDEILSDDDAVLRTVLASSSPVETPGIRTERQEAARWTLPGFGGKVRIGTIFGDMPIEALRVRDELRTSTGVIVRVQWIDKIHLDEEFTRQAPSSWPVRIAANAFAAGKPAREMILSPRQELSPEPHAAARFLHAEDLCGRYDALRAASTGLTYYRFHCGEPVVVKADGVWVRVAPH